MSQLNVLLWVFLCCIYFSLSAIITVDPQFTPQLCNRVDLKCPDLKLAVNITQSHDHIIMNPGQYTGRSNVGICVDGDTLNDYSVCRFQNVTLSGQGPPEKIVIAGNETALTRALYVKNSTIVRIENITFNGFTYNRTVENVISNADFATNDIGGAAVAVEISRVHFSHVHFFNNVAATGPASRVINSDVTFQHCLFENNFASLAGGAILADSSNITVTDCQFTANNATSAEATETASSGGAIYFAGSDYHHIAVERTLFSRNIAQHTGGAMTVLPNAVHKGPQYIRILDCLFENNIANGEGPCVSSTSCEAMGGALYLSVADIIVDNCKFFDNRAAAPDSTKSASGGAIFATNIFGSRSRIAMTQIQRCNFTNNEAYGSGGAIYGASQPLYINGTVFESNSVTSSNPAFSDAPTYGGALWYGGSTGVTTVTNCSFHQNMAVSGWGGAIFTTESAVMAVLHTRFIRNKALSSYTNSGAGGAIMATSFSTLTISDSRFIHNSATPDLSRSPLAYSGSGGAIFAQSSSVTLTRLIFTANRAFTGQFDSGSSGGAVTLEDCYPAIVESCVFNGNAAPGYLGKSQYAACGRGGGLYIKFWAANISDSLFFANWVSAGGSQNALGGALSGEFE
jgi:predicted outer membrane repeat protein